VGAFQCGFATPMSCSLARLHDSDMLGRVSQPWPRFSTHQADAPGPCDLDEWNRADISATLFKVLAAGVQGNRQSRSDLSEEPRWRGTTNPIVGANARSWSNAASSGTSVRYIDIDHKVRPDALSASGLKSARPKAFPDSETPVPHRPRHRLGEAQAGTFIRAPHQIRPRFSFYIVYSDICWSLLFEFGRIIDRWWAPAANKELCHHRNLDRPLFPQRSSAISEGSSFSGPDPNDVDGFRR